jgi:hypothetical protein
VLQGDVLSMETGMYTLKWDAYSGGGYGEGGGGWYCGGWIVPCSFLANQHTKTTQQTDYTLRHGLRQQRDLFSTTRTCSQPAVLARPRLDTRCALVTSRGTATHTPQLSLGLDSCRRPTRFQQPWTTCGRRPHSWMLAEPPSERPLKPAVPSTHPALKLDPTKRLRAHHPEPWAQAP